MKIICIGRNYANHAKEMKAEAPKEPVFFLKPDTAILRERDLYYPSFTKDLQYEVELVLKIKKNGRHIEKEHVHNYCDQVGLGIDFTARDVQRICKEKGLPWEKAKAFDRSAVVSKEFITVTNLQQEIDFSLQINNETVQKGNSQDQLFDFTSIISYISQYITLKQGDLIFTGTPEGVGPVHVNDILQGFMNSDRMFQVKIK
jgi:2-keto-4-pentenoate hydratase/2-oxohepta-3-ene-1,7-dioic acid hydratase in catechol pathway